MSSPDNNIHRLSIGIKEKMITNADILSYAVERSAKKHKILNV